MQNSGRYQTCKLCGVSSDLRNSHIFSEFLFKPSYDSKHRAIWMDIDKRRKKFVQKGIREYLLCESCEQHLSRIEKNFKTSWYDEGRLPQNMNDEFLELKDFDYNQFKLFHLSILWRCSVSTIVDTVKLGPHEKKIADLILQEDAGPEDDYRFWGRILVDDNNQIVHDLVSKPNEAKLDGHHVYYVCYGGCEWTFLVSSHSTAKYKDVCFQKDGSIRFLPIPIRECNTMRIIAEQPQHGL